MDAETGILLAVLGVNTLWDLRKKEILPAAVAAAALGGIIRRIPAVQMPDGTAGTAAAFSAFLKDTGTALLPGAVLLLFSRASGGKLGSGDALIVCVIGLWSGAGMAACSFLTALFLAAVTGTAAVRTRKKKELPFVPFLLAGYLLWRFVF